MKRIALLLLAAAWLAPSVYAGDEGAPPDGNASIEIDKEMEVSALLDRMSELTQRPVLYDPNGQRIRGQKVGVALNLKVPRSRLFDAFQSILMAFEIVLVPVGPNGHEVYIAVDSRSTNNFVKNRAVFLEPGAIDRNRDRDGLYVATFIPLKHTANMALVRTALSTLVSPAGIGRVMEIPGAGVIIMDFAPTVHTMQQIVAHLDQPSPNTEVLESIELSHAKAKEVAAAVQELWVEIAPATPQGARRGTATSGPAPRIVPYEARNAVVVRASRAELEMIRGLIRKLDQPAAAKDIRVIRLKYLRAAPLAHTLMSTIAAPTVFEPTAEVVPESQSNSIVLAGERESVAALLNIVDALDVPPLQPHFK
jgi:type II secretory pathway component GspD/PulD (secretin)